MKTLNRLCMDAHRFAAYQERKHAFERALQIVRGSADETAIAMLEEEHRRAAEKAAEYMHAPGELADRLREHRRPVFAPERLPEIGEMLVESSGKPANLRVDLTAGGVTYTVPIELDPLALERHGKSAEVLARAAADAAADAMVADKLTPTSRYGLLREAERRAHAAGDEAANVSPMARLGSTLAALSIAKMAEED